MNVLKLILDLINGILSRPVSTADSTSILKKSFPLVKKDGLSLTLIRIERTENSTSGELCVDGEFECYTLEDEDRLSQNQTKVPGHTAIPAGLYSVGLTMSPRFGRVLPLLEDVPGFEGVRIHPGNKPEDTDGCVLVGRIKGPDAVAESRLAFDALFAKLQEAQAAGVSITIQVS